MAQTYSTEFKKEACKRVQSGVPAAQVARELGINVNTLYSWMSRFKAHPADPFVGSGNLHQEDAELRALKKCIKDLAFVLNVCTTGDGSISRQMRN